MSEPLSPKSAKPQVPGGSGSPPAEEAEAFPEVAISRDQFLAVFRRFQRDLYREDLTPEVLKEALENAPTDADAEKVLCPSLFPVTTVRYRRDGDVERALRLYYQAANRLKTPVVYVLEKKSGIATIRMGIVDRAEAVEDRLSLDENANKMPGILLGFLPGTECGEPVADAQFAERELDGFLHRRAVIGVPRIRDAKDGKADRKDSGEKPVEGFGIERVLDSVKDDFVIVGISTPVDNEVLNKNMAVFSAAHDFFQTLAKHTEQFSKSDGTTRTWGHQKGKGEQISDEGLSESLQYGDAIGTSVNKMVKRWWGSKGWFRGESRPTSRKTVTKNKPGAVHNTNEMDSQGGSESATNQRGVTLERTNELAKLAAELIANQLKRLEKGLSSGMWRHTTQVLAKTDLAADRVSDILCGYLGGDEATVAQVRSICLPDERESLLPVLSTGLARFDCLDSALGNEFSGIGTLLTSEELSRMGALPLHEVPGIVVERLTDFGRNLVPAADVGSVKIGQVVDNERETGQEVRIGREQLKRHVFVTGATGAGKSTTMRQLLLDLYNPEAGDRVPFLVIEPVKREYRELKNWIPDLQVITLGAKTEDTSANDVSLAPFAVEEKLGLIPHIDNLKAAFNASMGNYSSMPFILEDIIYKAYEECGWNLVDGTSPFVEQFRRAGKAAHVIPTMSDLLPLVKTSILDFFGDKQSDYGNSLFGALRARISSMTRGAKGLVLDKLDNAIDMESLLKKPCVIELWPFTDNEEKAFVMALLLIKLYEYRQKNNMAGDGVVDRPLEHVLVIEEAHRLLAKQPSAGEHSSSGRQKAVEFFADILAEIRSYGQGIVIVDQIPSKLVPDVLKNTDVKIAHRLVDREDREMIGATMNLTKEQTGELARLKPGTGIVYYGGLRQAVKVQVPRESDVQKKKKDHEKALRFHV